MAEPYVGEIRMFTGDYAPNGWGLCDGSTVLQEDFPTLFLVIGTTYGGDATHFNLPDLRGRAPMHAGQGPGLSNNNLGAAGGAESVILTENELPAHTHALHGRSGPSTSSSPAGNLLAQASSGAVYKSSGTPVVLDPASVSATPSGAHDNMAPFLAVNFIIALFGVYPSPN